MKKISNQILCDNCKMELFYKGSDRADVDRSFILEINGKDYCSLQCFVMNYYQSSTITEIELVENFKKAFPEWQLIPPNYKEKYNQKKLEDVKEVMKGLDEYELVKK